MSDHDVAEDDPPIAFDKWAPIAAEMLQRASAERLEILLRHSMILEHWTPSDLHWSAVLADEIMAGNYTRASIYAQHCAAEMKTRQAQNAPAEPVREIEPKEEAVTAAAKTIPTATVADEKPPMLGTPPPLAHVPIHVPNDAPYTPLQTPPALAYVPVHAFNEVASVPTEVPAMPPSMHDQVPPKRVVPHALKSTHWAAEVPQGPSLPFVPPSVGGDNAASIAKPAAPEQRRLPVSDAGKMLFQTAGTPDPKIMARPITPFKSDAAAEETPLPAASASTTPAAPERMEVKPVPAAAAPNEPEWTLEQYASLCAELEMAPERAQETLHRYRVRPEQKTQLDALWGTRMRADATLHAAFHHAKTTYASWLMQTKRGS